MRKLLSKSQQRQLEIIEILYEKKEPVHIKKVAKFFKASERTILNDISNIKNTFENIDIKTSLDGIALYTRAAEGIDGIYRYYLDNCLGFRLLEHIFFNQGISVADAAEALYISVSSLYRMIEKINKVVVKVFNFKVIGAQLKIEGDERDIRYFFTQYFSEKYKIWEWPFMELDERFFSDMLLYFSDFSKIPQDLDFLSI